MSTTTIKNIIDTYHPIETHRDGDFHDFHALQEVYYNTGKGDRFGLNAWFLTSKRGLSQTTVDYGDPKDILHQQRERTLRSVLVGSSASYIQGRSKSRLHPHMARLRLRP